MKLREYFLHAKKTKITTLFNNSSPPCLLLVTVAPFWRISTGRKLRTLFCQLRHTDTSSTFIYALIWKKTAYPCGAADTEQCTQFASSGYSPKLHGDKLLNKVVIFVSFAYKNYSRSFITLRWTSDGRWTILTMSFILFWALTVLFTWQSMGQSQAPVFSSKIS